MKAEGENSGNRIAVALLIVLMLVGAYLAGYLYVRHTHTVGTETCFHINWPFGHRWDARLAKFFYPALKLDELLTGREYVYATFTWDDTGTSLSVDRKAKTLD